MPKIKKNEHGTYEFWVDLGRDPVTGKRRQVHRSGFARKKDAEEEIRRLQNEADKGIFVKKQKSAITFAEFAEIWLEHYAATSGTKRSTIETRRRHLSIINKYFGNMKLQDISKMFYEKNLAEWSDKYSKNYVNALHSTACLAFDYAIESQLVKANITKEAKRPKRAKELEDVAGDITQKYLSKDEVDRFLKAVKNSGDLQYYALFRLLIFSGMRIGEALGLESSKINFENSVIKIRQTLFYNRSSEKPELQTPKTEKSIRDIIIDDTTMQILNHWIVEQKKNKMRHRNIWFDGYDFVFTSTRKNGYPLSYSGVHLAFNRFKNLSKINPDCSIHTLRHTHASLLAESEATLEQIQERLGHEDDSITRDIYLHITKDSKQTAVDNFAKFMNGIG